ncbi:MAG: InlB B-repeat-containing protein [Longimicrobiaceae bacterium]
MLQISHVGSGTTTSSPAGINCTADADAGTLSGTCAASYTPGRAVTLTATPAASWRFSGWSGDADCSDAKVTMNAARRCTATFTRL